MNSALNTTDLFLWRNTTRNVIAAQVYNECLAVPSCLTKCCKQNTWQDPLALHQEEDHTVLQARLCQKETSMFMFATCAMQN